MFFVCYGGRLAKCDGWYYVKMTSTLEKNESFSSERLGFFPAWSVSVESLQRNANDSAVASGIGLEFPNPYTLDDAAWFIKFAKESWEKGTEYSFGIFDKETKEFYGMIGFKKDGEEIKNIGYWLGREFWGKGYASEALRAILVYLKTKLPGIQEIKARAYKYNKPSQRVLEKAGFVCVGENATTEVLRNGEKSEEYIYSLKF